MNLFFYLYYSRHMYPNLPCFYSCYYCIFPVVSTLQLLMPSLACDSLHHAQCCSIGCAHTALQHVYCALALPDFLSTYLLHSLWLIPTGIKQYLPLSIPADNFVLLPCDVFFHQHSNHSQYLLSHHYQCWPMKITCLSIQLISVCFL